jgi:peptide/nickel transport system substrate-binding protein
MSNGTNAAGYVLDSGHGNPTTSIRKNFTTGQIANMAKWSDPAFDARMDAVFAEPDEAKRQSELRAMTTEMLDKAPYIWLPTVYNFTAWWPWVKGYEGEIYSGTLRPGPVYARLWIDEELKKKMGH